MSPSGVCWRWPSSFGWLAIVTENKKWPKGFQQFPTSPILTFRCFKSIQLSFPHHDCYPILVGAIPSLNPRPSPKIWSLNSKIWGMQVRRWLFIFLGGNKFVPYMGMDQYLLIPFLVGWTSIYQLFWCELQGYKVLTHCHIDSNSTTLIFAIEAMCCSPEPADSPPVTCWWICLFFFPWPRKPNKKYSGAYDDGRLLGSFFGYTMVFNPPIFWGKNWSPSLQLARHGPIHCGAALGHSIEHCHWANSWKVVGNPFHNNYRHL